MKRTVVVVAVLIFFLIVGGTAAATWRHWRAGQLAAEACKMQPNADVPTSSPSTGTSSTPSATALRMFTDRVHAAAGQAGQAAALDGSWTDLADYFSRYDDINTWETHALDQFGSDATRWTDDQHAQARQAIGDFRTVFSNIRAACRRVS